MLNWGISRFLMFVSQTRLVLESASWTGVMWKGIHTYCCTITVQHECHECLKAYPRDWLIRGRVRILPGAPAVKYSELASWYPKRWGWKRPKVPILIQRFGLWDLRWSFLKLMNVCLARFTARKIWCWRWESLSPSWRPNKKEGRWWKSAKKRPTNSTRSKWFNFRWDCQHISSLPVWCSK